MFAELMGNGRKCPPPIPTERGHKSFSVLISEIIKECVRTWLFWPLGVPMTSLLEQEIQSQPEVLARLLDREMQHISQIAAQLPPFDYVLIAARGSSDHAATYAKYAWTSLARYPVALAAPSLLTMYRTAPRLASALVVGVSQSGQPPDILALREERKDHGRR